MTLRIIIVLFCLPLSTFINPVSAQENPASYQPPHEHELRVYEDSSAMKVFWPKDKPVFVRLAVSPDKNAPSFLLDPVDGQGEKIGDNNEGIRLELQGNQFVRWVNAVTRDETLLHFFSDGMAPETNHDFSNANTFQNDQMLFFGKGLKADISATDEFSGVKTIYYSIDGQTFVPYTQTIDLNNEKLFNLRYYSVDNVGYASKPKSINFQTDHTAPVTIHAAQENFINNILSSDTHVELTSLDELSGVKNIFFSFNNQEDFEKYRRPLKMDDLNHGDNVLYYYAEDEVGNEEDVKKYEFYYDKQPPAVAVSIRGENHSQNDNTFIASHSLIELSATDDKSQLEEIRYSINNDDDFVKYENPFPVSLQSGPFTITYYSLDKLKNRSKTDKQKFQMDLTPPETSHEINGPKHAQRSTIWINNESGIMLSAQDASAGLREIFYVIGNETEKLFTGNPIKINEEGNYLFRYYSYDNVNNREGDNVFLLIVDNSPPDIQEIFSVSASETRIDENGEEVNVYPQYTTLFLAATDMSSGLNDVEYALNGGDFQPYLNQIICRETGRYHIHVKAKDNLGHVSEKEIIFFIDKLR